MQSSGRTMLMLWALIAGLLVVNSIALVFLSRLRSENQSLRAQVAASQKKPSPQTAPPVQIRTQANAFADVREAEIPARYKWFDAEKERGVITLFDDHTFTNEKGEKMPAFRWTLLPDELTLEYNRVTIHYTAVEFPGIYTGLRTDNHPERIEKVVEETWTPATNDAVSISLGENESGSGLTHLAQEKDGLTAIATLDGITCRYLNMKEQRSTAYIYFSIDPVFKARDLKRIIVEIEYFDGAPGTFGLHYDGSKSKSNANTYITADRTIQMAGAKTWKTCRFQLRNPTFKNSQNGGADFRIWVTPAELYLRRVTISPSTENSP